MAYKKDLNDDFSDASDEKISRLNAAGIINITIENLWKDVYNALGKSDLQTWNRKLDALWLVLGGDVPKNDKIEQDYNKINLKLYELGSLSQKNIGFTTITDDKEGDKKDNRAKQYLVLMEKALFLRRLQNKQGKGTAYENTDDSDFD